MGYLGGQRRREGFGDVEDRGRLWGMGHRVSWKYLGGQGGQRVRGGGPGFPRWWAPAPAYPGGKLHGSWPPGEGSSSVWRGLEALAGLKDRMEGAPGRPKVGGQALWNSSLSEAPQTLAGHLLGVGPPEVSVMPERDGEQGQGLLSRGSRPGGTTYTGWMGVPQLLGSLSPSRSSGCQRFRGPGQT